MSITVEPTGLNVDGHLIPLISGDVHYWRHSKKDWPTILQRIFDLGLRIVCIYIPWSVHETSPGSFDFGDLDPAKNVGEFIDLAGEMGLAVLVRPGPHINAEITYFGYPARLFEDPSFLARDSRGGFLIMPAPPRCFPIISYAAEAFWREVEVWFDALAPVLRPRVHPNGPIFAVQVDNEMSMFFRTSAYDQDYHPDARSKWLEYLKKKYGDAEQVAEFYDLKIPLSDLPMPEDFHAEKPKDLPYYLDWIQFKEELVAGTLARLRTMWEDRGIKEVPFFHNFPACNGQSPLAITRAEDFVSFCGLDVYMHKNDFDLLKRRILILTGQSRFPCCPEFASGCYHVWPPVDLHDQRFTAMVSWMYGLKGVNYYMIVERERWYGSPITRHGGIRKEYWKQAKDSIDLLYKFRPWELNRRVDVCLLSVREYERLENASTTIAPMPPMVLESKYELEDFCYEHTCGFSRPIQYLHAKMLRGWERALSKMGVPYVIGSTDLETKRLNRFKAVICPTFEFLSRTTQQKLAQYVEAGGNLICGPEVPAFDERMKEFSTLDVFTSRPTHRLNCAVDTLVCNAGAGRVILATEVPLPPDAAEPVARAIARHIHLEAVYPCLPPCETTLHVGREGQRILFVVNPTAEAQRPSIRVTPGQFFFDLEHNERFYGDESIAIHMQPYSVRVLEVVPC